MQYDPLKRYSFLDIVNKLSLLLSNVQGDSLRNCGGRFSDTTANNAALSNPSNKSLIKENLNKRNSVDSSLNFALNRETRQTDSRKLIDEYMHENDETEESGKKSSNNNNSLYHRRCLSENLILFSTDQSPSEKARCHLLNRAISSKPSSEQTKNSSWTYPNSVLRKEAELMYLIDSQYKPNLKDSSESSNSNPFEALTQLRGVKKILGANVPNFYKSDTSNLFSSCFEIASKLFEDGESGDGKSSKLNSTDKKEKKKPPKSLPASPTQSRKEFPPTNSKKFSRFTELSSHPLYNSNSKPSKTSKIETDKSSQALSGTPNIVISGEERGSSGVTKLSSLVSTSDDSTKFITKIVNKFEQPQDGCVLLGRRGSSESGFYSCLNEDFQNSCRVACFCGSDKEDFADKSNTTLNDASISSLRSLDDMELSSESNKKRFQCPNHVINQIDIDTRSIDMGLINRLALDSEINSFIQKSQFSNQLLYCKNRTSSIYSSVTDSSDDISSLAGSDTLWDDSAISNSLMLNTRSAQIAKIVEYFERKGQNFKTFSVPDSLKHHPSYHHHYSTSGNSSTTSSNTKRQYLTNFNAPNNPKQQFVCDYFVEMKNDYDKNIICKNSSLIVGGPTSSSTCASSMAATPLFLTKSSIAEHTTAQDNTTKDTKELNQTYNKPTTNNDYDAFCLDLEKKSSPNLKICDGLVKSKLEFFDKLKQNLTEK